MYLTDSPMFAISKMAFYDNKSYWKLTSPEIKMTQEMIGVKFKIMNVKKLKKMWQRMYSMIS